jgi:hypothetical protein
LPFVTVDDVLLSVVPLLSPVVDASGVGSGVALGLASGVSLGLGSDVSLGLGSDVSLGLGTEVSLGLASGDAESLGGLLSVPVVSPGEPDVCPPESVVAAWSLGVPLPSLDGVGVLAAGVSAKTVCCSSACTARNVRAAAASAMHTLRTTLKKLVITPPC